MSTMTADEILALRPQDVLTVFGEDGKANLRGLLKQWHPDTQSHPDARRVFDHIMMLRGSQASEATYVVVRSNNKEWRIALGPKAETDTGRRWVGPKHFAWSFEKEPDLASVFADRLRELPRGGARMRNQMKHSLPTRMSKAALENGDPIVLIPRQNHAILDDWIKVHGHFPPAHLAWLGSGLMNVACFAERYNWTLPGISLQSVAIDPGVHDVMLFAGWEESSHLSARPVVASMRTLGLCPALKAPGYMPPETLTADVVRQTLREAAGDQSGMRLADRGVPEPMADWLNAPSASTAVSDYALWHGALEKSFGPRKFVKWSKSVSEVYP